MIYFEKTQQNLQVNQYVKCIAIHKSVSRYVSFIKCITIFLYCNNISYLYYLDRKAGIKAG